MTKVTITFLLSVLILSASGQKDKVKKLFDLHGTWTVKRYVFADISAMTEKVADEWVGKSMKIKKVNQSAGEYVKSELQSGYILTFPYSQLPSYKSIFKNDQCGWNTGSPRYMDTLVYTANYFQNVKISPAKLGLKDGTTRLILTGCRDTPFQEMIVKNNNEIIILWDGTYFILKRNKHPRQ